MTSPKRKIKKSLWLPLVLFVYTTGMAIYFGPRNHEMSTTEFWVTIGVSYAIIAALWWMLHKKEQMAERRMKDMDNNKK